uniref:Uncharacterized protein n=1 Tax=Oryza sativa subsp. japonica TaxID=39947 RepID=Q6ZH23_ORYSJ|nr:hypothetical protein [Oryza sativa Japonica Group]
MSSHPAPLAQRRAPPRVVHAPLRDESRTRCLLFRRQNPPAMWAPADDFLRLPVPVPGTAPCCGLPRSHADAVQPVSPLDTSVHHPCLALFLLTSATRQHPLPSVHRLAYSCFIACGRESTPKATLPPSSLPCATITMPLTFASAPSLPGCSRRQHLPCRQPGAPPRERRIHDRLLPVSRQSAVYAIPSPCRLHLRLAGIKSNIY